MPYGLTDSEFEFLVETAVQPLKANGALVFLFGSRANGKFKKFSDIDLLFVPPRNHALPQSLISQIQTALEDSNFFTKSIW